MNFSFVSTFMLCARGKRVHRKENIFIYIEYTCREVEDLLK